MQLLYTTVFARSIMPFPQAATEAVLVPTLPGDPHYVTRIFHKLYLGIFLLFMPEQ